MPDFKKIFIFSKKRYLYNMKIIQATIQNLEQLIPLFDNYRIFYKQHSSPNAAKEFLTKRFIKNDSIIFMAFDNQNQALGFTQLYPTFSSVSLRRTYILNDLYVASKMRAKGIGEALMNHSKQFATDTKCKGITLETAIDNPAQKLYERLGWKKDTAVFHYTWEV